MSGAPGSVGLAARRAALEALRAVEEDGAYSNLVVPVAVAALAESRDRALASYLAYETLRWGGTLDWALGSVVDRDLGAVEPALRRILRLGAVQLLHADVPTHAAVHTSVELARAAVPTRRAQGAGGFVNGVLRALDRARDDLPWPDPEADPIGHLVLRTAHPPWIVEELVERLGAEEAAAALEADNDPPGLTLRARGERDALLAELRADGHDARPGENAPEAVRVPGADPRSLRCVAEGRAVPQDEASMIVARTCAPAPGARVLDLCAGPGGKATHLADLASGPISALEIHPGRARLVRDLAERTGTRVRVVVADGRRPPLRDDHFDCVLVDAPCTGLGTGRRRPEVRWRRGPADVAALADLQRALLTRAVGLVRPGGAVVYSACTWTAAETNEVVAAATRTDRRLRVAVERQLWPHRDGTDGMYVARLVRS